MAIFHCPISIIKRSEERSSVAAAAYRSGTRITNEYDGVTHDFTRKGGVVYSEIILPPHAPAEFANRTVLWNSVEMVEKTRDARLARELEVALPVELDREAQIQLVRSFIQGTFVSAGMCADFSIHDVDGHNPHAHIMLTVRPLNADGTWGAKCRKVYDLDERGQRVPDGHGGWKNHRKNTTDWNDRGNAEKWRAAWADYANRALETAGRTERIDHRSYERQGIEQLPTIHMGVAATQMEKRGIRTDRGNINRQISAENRLLKELKARVTRLYNWSKAQPQDAKLTVAELWQAHMDSRPTPKSAKGRIKALQDNAAVFSFLTRNNICSTDDLHAKIAAMNKAYYQLRGKIVTAEKRIAELEKRLEMVEQYEKHKPIHRKLNSLPPKKQAAYSEVHRAELTLFDAAAQHLEKLKASGEAVAPKKWRSELSKLTAEKDALYRDLRSMRDELKAAEMLKRAANKTERTEGIPQRDVATR